MHIIEFKFSEINYRIHDFGERSKNYKYSYPSTRTINQEKLF